MAHITVAEMIVDELVKAGVKRLYGLVGDSLNLISDALRRDGRIRFIHVRHEESAAFAAGAEAQLSGCLTACAGSSGPGHVHLINGLYDAHRSYAPVLALASHIPGPEIGMGYFQETHPDQLFRECSHYCELISTPRQMPRVFQTAMQTAITRQGVAVVGIPGTVAGMEVPDGSNGRRVFSEPPVVCAADVVVEAMARQLNKAERVTLYCGDGCRKAKKEVLALAETLAAPVGYAWRGKQWVEGENPYAVGMTGLLGFGGAAEAMRDCDVLVLLGTDMPYKDWMPTQPYVIQVDIRGEHIGRRAKVDLGAVGDVGETLRALLPRLHPKKKGAHLENAVHNLTASRKKLEIYVKHVSEGEKPHPEHVTSVLNKLAADDAIFTIDTGLNVVWAAHYLQAGKNRRIIGSFTHGSMACALPMGIGAQLLYPNRQVVALCGDGGLTMLLGELLTVAQYRLPLKIFVYNNGALGFINLEMHAAGFPAYETDLINPNFARMAETMGLTGIHIERGNAVEEGIAQALAHTGPVLVDIVTDPEATPLPPGMTVQELKGSSSFSRPGLPGHVEDVMRAMRGNIRQH